MTWTVTDEAGNSATCQQTVTVNDVDDPSITCPDDVVTSNDQGRCDATVEIGSPTVSDNCGVTTPTAVRSDGLTLADPFPVGTTVVTWTVTGRGRQQRDLPADGDGERCG